MRNFVGIVVFIVRNFVFGFRLFFCFIAVGYVIVRVFVGIVQLKSLSFINSLIFSLTKSISILTTFNFAQI